MGWNGFENLPILSVKTRPHSILKWSSATDEDRRPKSNRKFDCLIRSHLKNGKLGSDSEVELNQWTLRMLNG